MPELFGGDGHRRYALVRTGEPRCRGHEQFGIDEYDNIGDCVVSLAQIQADHDSGRRSDDPAS